MRGFTDVGGVSIPVSLAWYCALYAHPNIPLKGLVRALMRQISLGIRKLTSEVFTTRLLDLGKSPIVFLFPLGWR